MISFFRMIDSLRQRSGEILLAAGFGQQAVGRFGDRLAVRVAVLDKRVGIPVEELHQVWIEARAGEPPMVALQGGAERL